jgi:hypothetical protein
VPVGWWGARLPCTRRPCGPTPSTRASGGDTKLPKVTLYSGSQIPGGGPYTHTAPIPPSVVASLVAPFNAGFLMSNASGGYFTDGENILPLRQGRAPSSSTTTAPQQTGSGASTRHHDARRRAREAEPRPAGGQRPTWSRVERHRHHPVGSHPGQRGGRPARVLGSRRWRPRLCGWTRIQHHRLGQTSDTRRCSAGGGTRRRHRLGELVYPPAVHRIGSCRSGRRRGPASEVGRHAAPVLRVVVGTRLHHHAVTVESVRCKSPTEWLRSCWRERDRPMEKLGSHTV